MLRRLISFPADTRPILLVIVHAEEEFDWTEKLSRTNTSVVHMTHISRVQEIFDKYGVVPTYMVDYPVAAQPEGYQPLKQLLRDGRAAIGAHLHPWTTPPFREALTVRNSFPGNLNPELEAEKLRTLTEQIEASFGHRPVSYLAGRYGFGPNTASILESLGFEIDTSAFPPHDFRREDGPDYSDYTADPYWFGTDYRLLGIASTGAYLGILGSWSHRVFQSISGPILAQARLTAVLARLGIVDRVCLTPEGHNLNDFVKLTRWLLRRGRRMFTLSFHSPSIVPGMTPFVRSERELVRFLSYIDQFLAYFTNELNGLSMTPLQLKHFILDIERRDPHTNLRAPSSGAATPPETAICR